VNDRATPREPLAANAAPSVDSASQDGVSIQTHIRLALEFSILFIAGPMAIALWFPKRFLIPAIVVFGLFALVLLLTDRTFDRRQLWNARRARPELGRMLFLAAGAAVVVTALVWLIRPELLGSLVRNKPWLWLAIMFGYPLASVYPQEVVYRALIFHRYGPLFRNDLMTASASAAAFGYAHIVLWNWLAVGATLIGGMLFAWTYLRSRSVAATAFEHAIYGCFMFTVGLGRFFYGGSIGA
jgi:membrane protease YdiL (CAAX protease family)